MMSKESVRKAVILFSGGLDSTTCLAIAKQAGYECYALSFNYHQRHINELDAARKIATQMEVKEHRVVTLDLNQWGGSALTDPNIAVPNFTGKAEIPVSYVPARNIVFLSLALGYAEVIGAYDIFIGVNAVDYSGYPDCRPEFIHAFQAMANIGTKAGSDGQKFTIQTPLMFLSKAEIIMQGLALDVDYSMTLSCYNLNADGLACGRCDSCELRRQGFLAAAIPDPTQYIEE